MTLSVEQVTSKDSMTVNSETDRMYKVRAGLLP